MPVNTSELSGQEINALFSKTAYPDPAAGTFELALVLGGTLSAGCYTAGVLDFLVEALDAWQGAKDAGDAEAPTHTVTLKVVAGTSGGGVCGAILARAASRTFPHVHPDTPAAVAVGNPLYHTWVNMLDIAGMTETGDLDAGPLASVLNGKPIDDAARFLVGWNGGGRINRGWVADDLPLIMTNTNLNGVPYAVAFDGPAQQSFVDLGDHIRFRVSTDPTAAAPPAGRPDELVVVDGADGPGTASWATLAEFAKATGAFPGGFPPRALTRPTEHYRYRVVVILSDIGARRRSPASRRTGGGCAVPVVRSKRRSATSRWMAAPSTTSRSSLPGPRLPASTAATPGPAMRRTGAWC